MGGALNALKSSAKCFIVSRVSSGEMLTRRFLTLYSLSEIRFCGGAWRTSQPFIKPKGERLIMPLGLPIWEVISAKPTT